MKERPILFSAPMVRAILEGRKTQTRRVIAPKLIPLVEEVLRVNGKWVFDTMDFELTTPYGRPGDRLWVREAWGLNHSDYIRPNPIPKQRPTDLEDDQVVYFATECDAEISNEMPQCPSIHMPRWASRINLEITDIRVERLKDISEADAIAEGAEKRYWPGATAPCHPIICYRHLWETINGKGSWDANPWVWVVEFRQLRP